MPIEIKNLTYIYGKGTPFENKALDNLSLTIDDGKFVGLIGHTGSGKSTLIQHLNALVTPADGKVIIDGIDIFSNKKILKQIRQKVGLVFQYPEHQLFEMSVYKDVAFGPLNYGVSKEETDERVQRSLDIVGIPEGYYEKSPFELSGGEKRRVAIAGVLAMEPTILVLDEPTAGLDPKGRDEILEQIKKMHEELKITVILVSHSMEDIAKLVDEIIVLSNGKLAFRGTPHEVFKNVDELEAIGLAAPQLSYVVKELRKEGMDIADDIYTVEEAEAELYKLLKQEDLR